MKLVVIGLGQCGSKIADEFVLLNETARSERKVEIVSAAFAVDTDAASLDDLPHLSKRYQSRIRIGGRESAGHGVGKATERGAEVAREDGDKLIGAMRSVSQVYDSDACLIVAATGGGTGSGALPVITRLIKDRFIRKPVYALTVLPFEHEESEEKIIFNTGTCLKSINAVADAVLLVSNQRFASKDNTLSKESMADINTRIVQLFYDLLCAGEQKRSKYAGAKLIDTGDLIETLKGWTVIGAGKRKETTETQRGIGVVNSAISQLSLPCNPKDATRALYVLSAPYQEMNIDLTRETGNYLKEVAPNASFSNGNYPREKGLTEVTLVLSGLGYVEKVLDYYSRSTVLMHSYAQRQKETEDKLRAMDEGGKELPSFSE